jgi:hypothetical protein
MHAMKKLLIVLLLSVVVVSVVYAQAQARKWRDAAFRSDSIAAANDTARLVVLASLDSTETAYQRRILQVRLERDSLDRELGLRPVVRLPGELRVDTLRLVDTVTAEPESTDSLQNYEFRGVDHPFAYTGHATIRPKIGRGEFDVSVFQAEPIRIEARVSCLDGPGVSGASVLFTADDPFDIIPGEVVQDPGICNPPDVGFSFLPELSVQGIGWELLKGAGWMLLAHVLDDGVRKARY